MSYTPIPNLSARILLNQQQNMRGTTSEERSQTSKRITTMVMVRRVTEESIEAAPKTAKAPGSNSPFGMAILAQCPMKRPSEAPMSRHGTKSPEGTAMP